MIGGERFLGEFLGSAGTAAGLEEAAIGSVMALMSGVRGQESGVRSQGRRGEWRATENPKSIRQHSFEDFSDAESQTVGLGEALDLRVAVAGAQDGWRAGRNRRGPGRSVSTTTTRWKRWKIASRPLGQRVEMAQVQGGECHAARAGAVHGLADRAGGRAPAHQQRLALRFAVHLGQGQLVGELLEFLRGAWRSCRGATSGAPLGWPHSSCSRPVTTGYLPPSIRVPGGTWCVMPSSE